MSDYVIIPDSSCDLNKELRERFDIPDITRGILYYPDGHSELADVDWETMTPKEFYDSMKGRNVLYKTACPPGEEIIEKYEKHLKAGRDIIAPVLSTALSATYNDCSQVAKELLKKYPERRIVVIDSLRYSTSLALLVISAAMKRKEGAAFEEVVEYLEKEKYRIHQMGTMDDLFFLVKTGRVDGFKAFFGSMIGLNILADFNEKGLSEPIAKLKGKKDAFKAIIEYIDKTVENPSEQIMFIAHSNREEAAKLLAESVKERFNPKELIITEVGVSCGASIGPGLCAVFYKGAPASAGLEKEKALMDEITASIKSK
ncbi:MAG: DegV family protein [Lachnospiraceae bacterium]|nr:DegV family protein [Lachnospiraceae bacterium]